MSKPKPESNIGAYEAQRVPEYTKHAKATWNSTWEVICQDIAAGLYAIDYEKAERDALAEVEYAKLHFIGKHSEKLRTATKLWRRANPELRGQLRCDGVVTGHLMVLFDSKHHFVLTMNMIVNYRYGRSYYQFPARFTEVFISGEKEVGIRISEDWMSRNFK